MWAAVDALTMPRSRLCALLLALSLVAVLPTSHAGASGAAGGIARTATEHKQLRRSAILAWNRLRKERAAGRPLAALKLPEAAPELDRMIAELRTQRAEHRPLATPTAAERSARRRSWPTWGYFSNLPAPKKGARLSPELSDRFDNPEHPHFKRELAYLDAVLARAEQLRAQGIPYREYFEFATTHYTFARDLRNNPFEKAERGGETPDRPEVDQVFPGGKLHAQPSDLTSFAKKHHAPHRLDDGLFFPTHLSLGYTDFNKVSGRPIYLLGLLSKPRPATYSGAQQFIDHDLYHTAERQDQRDDAHGYGDRDLRNAPLTNAQIISSMKLTRAFHHWLAKIPSKQTRALLRRAWFDLSHEEGREVSLEAIKPLLDLTGWHWTMQKDKRGQAEAVAQLTSFRDAMAKQELR